MGTPPHCPPGAPFSAPLPRAPGAAFLLPAVPTSLSPAAAGTPLPTVLSALRGSPPFSSSTSIHAPAALAMPPENRQGAPEGNQAPYQAGPTFGKILLKPFGGHVLLPFAGKASQKLSATLALPASLPLTQDSTPSPLPRKLPTRPPGPSIAKACGSIQALLSPLLGLLVVQDPASSHSFPPQTLSWHPGSYGFWFSS